MLVRLLVGRASAGASILSLTAPSPDALTGVRLGGRAITPDGSWSQPRRLPRAANKILAMGPKAIVIKHGEYGATLFFKEGAFGLESGHPFRAPELHPNGNSRYTKPDARTS